MRTTAKFNAKRSKWIAFSTFRRVREELTLISRFCETYGHKLSQQTCLAALKYANSAPHKFFAIPFRKALFPTRTPDEVDVCRSSRADGRSAPTETYGLQRRQRVVVTRQQHQTLHEVCGSRWTDIAETLDVSDRTLRWRRREFRMRVEEWEFSSL